jgi:hypothetical protein
VEAVGDSLDSSAGFLLYVVNGKIEMLEGYTYGETWPDAIQKPILKYSDDSRRKVVALLDGRNGQGS